MRSSGLASFPLSSSVALVVSSARGRVAILRSDWGAFRDYRPISGAIPGSSFRCCSIFDQCALQDRLWTLPSLNTGSGEASRVPSLRAGCLHAPRISGPFRPLSFPCLLPDTPSSHAPKPPPPGGPCGCALKSNGSPNPPPIHDMHRSTCRSGTIPAAHGTACKLDTGPDASARGRQSNHFSFPCSSFLWFSCPAGYIPPCSPAVSSFPVF